MSTSSNPTAPGSQSERRTNQPLLPAKSSEEPAQGYRIFPTFPLPSEQIHLGFEGLAQALLEHSVVALDGFSGVSWQWVQRELERQFTVRGAHPQWLSALEALKGQPDIDAMLTAYLGGGDPLFGKRYPGQLEDFLELEKVELLQERLRENSGPTIIYGPGASKLAPNAFLVYFDLPKNEIQYRANDGTTTNLGVASARPPKEMYQRFYFVDWVVLGKHKETLLDKIDIFVDAQRTDEPTFITGDDLRTALGQMQKSPLRPRPWFSPGVWGGQWLQKHIAELPQEVNYAWSFELIAPENGFVIESSGRLLEFSFDLLMFAGPHKVIGSHARRFGYEFPIRFDYLDTVDGGNLSLQCHPQTAYIREHFGETFTQDETYYILDCEPDAQVYLGFQEDIDPAVFRNVLERSQTTGERVEVERFVQKLPAQKHDLFLIPQGTVHCSGAGNLVLEISATPYIFTFKMYDWLRLDLDGKPRPLNIARAFDNLDFERRGREVEQTLVSRPVVLEENEAYTLVHLPTHPEHFYDIHRVELRGAYATETYDTCHVLNVVEGSGIRVTAKNGHSEVYRYAETFLIPAAAEGYTLEPLGETGKVVKAFLK